MKKIVIVLGLLGMMLTACTPEIGGETETEPRQIVPEGDAVIQTAELTEFEDHLMRMIGPHTVAFDIQLHTEKVKYIRTTLELYEHSQLVKTLFSNTHRLNETNLSGPIKAVFAQRSSESGSNSPWLVSFVTNSGSSSTLIDIDAPEVKEKTYVMTATSTIAGPQTLTIGKKKVVATIIYSNQSRIRTASNITTTEDLKKATNYERVYVLSIELVSEE